MNRIKYLRELSGELQSDLAKILNVTSVAIGNYENEKRDIPTEYLKKLSEHFDCSIDYLLGKSDIRKSDEQIKKEFEFAYHKETEGLSDEDIKEALRIYKQIKYGNKEDKK